MLPPPPKSGRPELIEVVIESDLEEEEVFVDTLPPVVRDARTLEAYVYPGVDFPSTNGGDTVAGNLRPRFEDLGQNRMRGSRDELLAFIRDSVQMAHLPWMPLTEAIDSVDLHKTWTQVVSNVYSGATFSIREMVWPTELEIHSVAAEEIGVRTDWVRFKRIPPNEILCLHSFAPEDAREHEEAAVRMTSTIRRIAGGGGRLFASYETRGLAGCQLSAIGASRLGSFRYDVWMAMHRASAIGGQTIIWY